MSLFEYVLLTGSVLLSGSFAFFLNQRLADRGLPLLLSFSGAYLLGISILDLMPGIFAHAGPRMGYWLLGGFFIQLLLDNLSQGVEHGHVHRKSGAQMGFAIQIMLGLCLHALLEGLPLGNYEAFHERHHPSESTANYLLFGIILHKTPAAFALVALLIRSGFSRPVIYSCLLIFSIMSPLGSWIGGFFSANHEWVDQVMALVVGSFLHIATTILFEADRQNTHRITTIKLLLIVAGFGIAILTVIGNH